MSSGGEVLTVGSVAMFTFGHWIGGAVLLVLLILAAAMADRR